MPPTRTGRPRVRHRAFLNLPGIVEFLASYDGEHRTTARLFGAAASIRDGPGVARFPLYQAHCDAAIEVSRDALGGEAFATAWAEVEVMSIDETIAYIQRGRGKRKRPTSGWESLTPTETDVVRLVAEGLANRDIAARLLISHRTVQTHLTHVYNKLGVTSRVQLVQESARHP